MYFFLNLRVTATASWKVLGRQELGMPFLSMSTVAFVSMTWWGFFPQQWESTV